MGASETETPARPVLSVIIPARDHARPLKRLLDNLKKQKIPSGWDVDILVVENGSKDDTLEVARASGFRVLSVNSHGAGPARNAGVRATKGVLLAFLDADCCPVRNDHFVQVTATALQLRGFGTFGGPILLPEYQRWNPVAIGDHWACWFNWSMKRPMQRSSLFQPSGNSVVPRAVFETMNGFCESAMILEDMEFENRVMRAGLPVFFVPSLAVTHEARGSLLRSWRHSWSWGGAFRERHLAVDKAYGLKYPVGDARFARNLGYIFRRRVRLVRRIAWANTRWQAVVAYPFYVATIFVWALAVIWAREPSPENMRPI